MIQLIKEKDTPKKKVWTEKEENDLLRLYPLKTIEELEKKFGVTATQIKNKVYKMTGTARITILEGRISSYDIMDNFGICWHTLKRHIKAGRLKCIQTKDNLVESIMTFEQKDFYDWLKENPHLIHPDKIKRRVIIPEPDWLDDAIREASKTRHRRAWTTKEVSLMVHLIEIKKWTQADVAKELGRTVRAVQRRYTRHRKGEI